MATKKKDNNETFLDKTLLKPLPTDNNIVQGARSPAPPMPEKPGLIKDTQTGKVTGVNLPDGRTLVGIGAKEAQFLARKYDLPLGESPQQKATTPTTPNAEVPLGATPVQLSTVGQVTEAPPDETTASIEQNIQNRALVASGQGYKIQEEGGLGQQFPQIPIVNKLVGAIPNKGNIKNTILNIAGENQALRDYLDDYSNYQEYQDIKGDLTTFDAEIATAKQLAADPRYATEAFEMYNNAQSKKLRAYANLKRISMSDQRDYVSDIRQDMTNLQSYFDQRKLGDDVEMREILSNARIKRVMQ